MSLAQPGPGSALPAQGGYPAARAQLPPLDEVAGSYRVRFARDAADLDRLLRCRYEVFNLELHEGLDSAHLTGRDEDRFDAVMHHLLVETRAGGQVVGTYRLQTDEMARAHAGYYSAGEFRLDGLGDAVLDAAVEIGRACVAREHRNGRVLTLLWRGLAAYLAWNRKRYLFGCCSLTTQDLDLGHRTHAWLVAQGHAAAGAPVTPLPGLECPPAPDAGGGGAPVHIPALFASYLRLGASVCGPPAIDREFKTIDWLVLLDTDRLDDATRRSLFR